MNEQKYIDKYKPSRPSDCIFFWGHKQKFPGVIDNSCFSQWHQSEFTSGIIQLKFFNAEQYMMAKKAVLFGDREILDEIMDERDPMSVKALGRRIKNFDEKIWRENRLQFVTEGSILKFSQNEELKEYLLSTGNKFLVEASPYDQIWGIGLSAKDAGQTKIEDWQGLNLLGIALMIARDVIRNNQ